MPEPQNLSLETLIKLAKEHGIKRLVYHGTELEFHDTSVTPKQSVPIIPKNEVNHLPDNMPSDSELLFAGTDYVPARPIEI